MRIDWVKMIDVTQHDLFKIKHVKLKDVIWISLFQAFS